MNYQIQDYLEAIQPTLERCNTKISLDKQNEIIQCALRCLESRLYYCSDPLRSPNDVKEYLCLHLASEPNEVFAVMFLNNQNRVLAFEKLFYGTVNTVTVHSRVVVQRALAHNAVAVIFAHNHPSGNTEPSSSDRHVTEELKTILKLIDVKVLDHFIVSMQGTLSFAEQGWL
jgi:DNA repair protein RadC